MQNVDSLYWQAEEEPGARVEAVRVSRDVFCVFNATPREKYESYRLCLQRWGLLAEPGRSISGRHAHTRNDKLKQ